MITARLDQSAAALARSLADKAESLGRSVAENRFRHRRSDGGRWRKAALLWPLFQGER